MQEGLTLELREIRLRSNDETREIDGSIHVHSHDSGSEMQRIARQYGIFIRPSSGVQ